MIALLKESLTLIQKHFKTLVPFMLFQGIILLIPLIGEANGVKEGEPAQLMLSLVEAMLML